MASSSFSYLQPICASPACSSQRQSKSPKHGDNDSSAQEHVPVVSAPWSSIAFASLFVPWWFSSSIFTNMSVPTQRRVKRKLETSALMPTNSRNFKMSKRGVRADTHSMCFVDWDHHLHKGVQEESKQRVEDEGVRTYRSNKQVLDEEKRAAEALALLQSFPC